MSKLLAKLKTGTLKGKTQSFYALDKTLKKAGYAADAKAVGDKIDSVIKTVQDNNDAVVKKLTALNPPMLEGGEYALGEQFLGKPVYMKCFVVHGSDNYVPDFIIEHGISNIDTIVAVGGSLETDSYGSSRFCISLPFIYINTQYGIDEIRASIYADFEKIVVSGKGTFTEPDNPPDDYKPAGTCKCWIKYTKQD